MTMKTYTHLQKAAIRKIGTPISKTMDEHAVQFEMNRYLNANTELEGKPDELAERFAAVYEEENWTDEEMAWLKRVAAGITEADASKSARVTVRKADASAFPPEDDKLIEDAMQRLNEYEAAAKASGEASSSGESVAPYMEKEFRAAQACVKAFDALKARQIAADPDTLFRVRQARLFIEH
jgi:hypothetical protein